MNALLSEEYLIRTGIIFTWQYTPCIKGCHANLAIIPIAPRARIVKFDFNGQLAWAVENSWFNTIVYDRSHPTQVPLRGCGSAIPTIFQVGLILSLLALIPLFFINDKK